MNIKVLGSCCSKCETLKSLTETALKELAIEETVEKVTDIEKITAYNILSLPALVINEKVIISGKVPKLDEIKEILKTYNIK
jgi:small redox-active disulfide protein 2